jgi:FeS assembly SUF system protein
MSTSEPNDTPRFTVEEVDTATPPPRARVDLGAAPPAEETAGEKLERKKDYLEGFLAQQPTGLNPHAPGGEIYEAVINALREIYDPEIPVNLYDLGLIYGVDISNEGSATITMTLTTPHCPVAESMPGEVEMRVAAVPGIRDAEVALVWDPPWDPAKMSDEARLELGML